MSCPHGHPLATTLLLLAPTATRASTLRSRPTTTGPTASTAATPSAASTAATRASTSATGPTTATTSTSSTSSTTAPTTTPTATSTTTAASSTTPSILALAVAALRTSRSSTDVLRKRDVCSSSRGEGGGKGGGGAPLNEGLLFFACCADYTPLCLACSGGPAPSGVSQVDPTPGTVPGEVAVDSGAARGTASGGVEPWGAGPGGAEPGGAETGGAEPVGVGTGGGEPGGAEPEGVAPGGTASEGAESGGAEPQGAASSGGSAGASPRLSPQQLREWFVRRECLLEMEVVALLQGVGVPGGTAATGPGGARTRGTGAAGTGGVEGVGAGDPTESGATGVGGSGAGGTGAGGAGVGGTGAGGAGAGGAGVVDPSGAVLPRPYFVPLLQQVLGTPSSTGLTPPLLCPPPDQSQLPLQPPSPLPAPSPYTEQSGGLTERREPASRPISPVRTARRVPRSRPPPVPGTHAMALRPCSIPLCVPLPAPPESSLPAVPDPESDRARAASPTVSRLLATAVTDPSFESAAASALVAELLEFAAACRLDYAIALIAESASASPPSIRGECALGTDVFEDKQEDFECLAAAVPRFTSMLLAPQGDPNAPDILTPRSYAEAITGPYSSQWQAAMDAEMASWKSTGTYVDEVPPPGANIVDGMWIFRDGKPSTTGELSKSAGGEQLVKGSKQLVDDLTVNEEGELSVGEESTDSNVVEVTITKPELRRTGRARRPPERLSFHACLPPAAFTAVYNEVDDDLLYDDAEEDDELPELDPDMHVDPEHRWDIATMTVKEALASWKGEAVKAAMEEEIRSLIGMGTLELVERPHGVNIMKNRWVLTTKYRLDDTVEREKARLVVKSFTQVCGADYDETYSPVSSYVTLRIFLSIVAVVDLNLMQLDMKNAFLQSKLDRVLYMYQLDYFDDGTGRVCKLLKSLYGLKQSPMLWYRALDGVQLGAGWKKSQVDEVLYSKTSDNGMTCWVLVASTRPVMLKELKELLEDAFELRKISPVVKYLGLEIVCDRPARKLWLHQQGYADKLRRRFIDQEQGGRVLKMPVSVDAYAELTFDDEEVQECEEEEYWQKVGSLQFAATTTRPHRVRLQKSGEWPHELLKLIGYVDADDAGDKQKRTSTRGYVFVYGGAAVSWSSSCIKCATLSSTESEYVAATNAGKEGRRLRFLLAEFKLLDAGKSTILRVDNKLAFTVAAGLGLTGNLKHMERRYARLQHIVRRGKFVLKYIPTTEQPADFLTKALHFPAFNRCSVAIGQVRLADVGDGDDDVKQ
ncbi:unnamed protein product [Closterium sp. NIES-53]